MVVTFREVVPVLVANLVEVFLALFEALDILADREILVRLKFNSDFVRSDAGAA